MPRAAAAARPAAPRRRRAAGLALCLAAAVLGSVQTGPAADDGTTVFAGTTLGYSGDGGPAAQAQLFSPYDAVQTPDGGVVAADFNNHRLRRVAPDGTISTVAGDGTVGSGGDGGPASAAQVGFPTSLAVRPDGTLLFTDGNRVRQIGPDGVVGTFAGAGGGGSADGIPALEADLAAPVGLAVEADGSVLLAEATGHTVRRIGPDGLIRTVAGTRERGSSGDGGPAAEAAFDSPTDTAVAADGTLYVADRGNDRVRRIGTDGTTSTLHAGLDGPRSLALAPDGSLLVAEQRTGTVRRITSDGDLTTLALERSAAWAVVALADGGVLTVEPSPHQVRHLAAGLAPGAPGAEVASPADGAVYAFGDPVAAAYACSAPPGGALASCEASTPPGDLVDTSVGVHTFAVRATGADGRTRTVTSRYVVERAPTRLTDTQAPLIGDARATLRGGSADLPLAGRTIRFATTTGATICVAVTDAEGRAACRSTLGGGLGGILDALGGLFGADSHSVTFGGDGEYLPSTSSG